MRKLFCILVLVSGFAFGQNKVELAKEGSSDVVTEIPNATAEQLFLKTKEWIQQTYKNPNSVLKAEIVNDMVRIEGFQQAFFYTKSIIRQDYDLEYSIEISFKDGKYKFSFVPGQISYNGSPNFLTFRNFFKDDGSVRKVYQASYDSALVSLNDLYLSHYNYISGKTTEKKKDW